jgi:mannose/fructose/N-acetylgalactosamine-specific phosphotransferase system component IID
MYLTGIQVELGPTATQYERKHYNYAMEECQRYYETAIVRVGGYNTNGAYFRGSAYLNTKKRTVTPVLTVLSNLETSNVGTLNFDNSNFDGSSVRYLVPLTSTGDAYGQWKVSVDCEF